MGGGHKRGRTQRKHFKQSKENVWKYKNGSDEASKKTRSSDPSDENPNPNPSWQPFATQNTGFEEYYKAQGIVPENEWEEFICVLRKPLPAAFRINSSGQFFRDILSQLEDDFMKSLEAEIDNENEIDAIRPLPWYPGKLAWHSNFSRMQLRKNQTLERFHEFLKQENEVGNITRQEAVSMVPPLFLDVLPDHHILDMCAAPGSKTFQLLEMIHQLDKPGLLPNGLVIANDVDVQRCNLLIHQTKRMCSANLIVTNHEAQHFPNCSLKSCTENSTGEEARKHTLQFDRVLCDVPCTGDGTLRKAPDIWRKWNAGMGNGLHRLQVDIAMRGLALLKVGGRMVYSTCSMNPVENEAVVAEVLRRSGDSVELLDVSGELPELIRRPGLKTWKVRDRGLWLASYRDVPRYRRGVITPSMFPSDQCFKLDQTEHDNMQEETVTIDAVTGTENASSLELSHDGGNNVETIETAVDMKEAVSNVHEVSGMSSSPEDLDGEIKVEVSSYPLECCMRIVPHDQNSGAFFIAVLKKISPLQAVPENQTSQSTKRKQKIPRNSNENLEVENAEIKPSECIPDQHHHTSAEEPSNDSSKIDQSSLKTTDVEPALPSNQLNDIENELEEVEPSGIGENEKVSKGKLQIQGRWRGVDPVVFFQEKTIIDSIRSFYGICESFPLEGHLVTRNTDANHVKRIYYISKSVHDILQLNFKVGQRLKITSLGLKTFERQASKDCSSLCSFRLSSEGLPLLLPYISKQILHASLLDFQHLLQYRTIKFPDFVNSDFREKATNLMPGCCVVTLNEGNKPIDEILLDASTIAIVCWKGKTNLSIMVSQLDAQELRERLSLRFPSEVTISEDKENNSNSEAEAKKISVDNESTDDFRS
ncbi:RNA cytosine C(5)-methyltransferase NSUN2 [Dioscorea cayenensis subsp. rotundata]|uniref:RNA cytosine C(5)-methyltransferase NSUN2 n=1 Tax=Dioscorea cayennensis subsp. rotundata TaxID=55577 RepID=A0AB40BJ87_DIOCR|nr:RNA cytosine C(5)-methyltransferase NSUN2 [Dioscorea cayenensis subsp. rotundata]